MTDKQNLAKVIADLVYQVLSDQNRLDSLPDVIELLKAKRQQTISDQIRVVSAKPLDKKTQQELINLFKLKFKTNKPVVFDVDQDLIAGLLISWQDKLIDLSIRGRLNKIREGLSNVQS